MITIEADIDWFEKKSGNLTKLIVNVYVSHTFPHFPELILQ